MNTFVKIVDEGSLTAAARALNKAQPTIVRTLSVLEESLGVRLLERTTRRMALTPEGRTYLERCRQILADLGEAEAVLQQNSVDLRGALRVTAPVLFGHLHVAPAIFSFLNRHPGVQVELILLDRVVNLVEEGFDVGVRIAHLEDSSLVATRVAEVVRTCVASPKLLSRIDEPLHPKDLEHLPTVTFTHGSLGTWQFRDQARPFRFNPRSRFSTNQSQAAIRACVSGLCFGQFLSYQVKEEIERGRLVRVLADFEPPPTPVHLVFPHARTLVARKRALLDWLKKSLASVDARAQG